MRRRSVIRPHRKALVFEGETWQRALGTACADITMIIIFGDINEFER